MLVCVGASVVDGSGRVSGELRARHRQARERKWCYHGGDSEMNREDNTTKLVVAL